ncbi:MAG TPA: phosphoglycerate kinase [Comamonadaceae bacterium]|nr:phosphoglycerate kinase [Comamonadaceae bacterium]
MRPRQLWIVRHAQPLVAPGTCYGALDVSADPAATMESARRLAQVLPQNLWVRHSPLQRCEQLAQALQALRPDLASKTDGRLVEMDFGAWEGRAWTDIARADIEAWTARFADHRPGGGDSLTSMLRRVAQALQEASETAHRQQGDVLWISHAGVARCVQWLLDDPGRKGCWPRADQWPLQAPEPGHWACYPIDSAPPPHGGSLLT